MLVSTPSRLQAVQNSTSSRAWWWFGGSCLAEAQPLRRKNNMGVHCAYLYIYIQYIYMCIKIGTLPEDAPGRRTTDPSHDRFRVSTSKLKPTEAWFGVSFISKRRTVHPRPGRSSQGFVRERGLPVVRSCLELGPSETVPSCASASCLAFGSTHRSQNSEI